MVSGDEDDDIAKREIDYRGTAAIYADETNQIQDEDLAIAVNHTPAGEVSFTFLCLMSFLS